MKAAALLISDPQLLNTYLQGGWLQPQQIEQRVFQALREQQPFLPDYATTACMQNAGLQLSGDAAVGSYAHLLLNVFEQLAKPLFLRGTRLYVQQDSFEDWQQMLTLVMPLPVISFFAFAQKLSEHQAQSRFSEWFANHSCLPGPYIPELVGLFSEGVSEHHLHIMGTTESDYTWQDALKRPKAVLRYLKKSHSSYNAREQLTQINPHIAFADLYRLLRLAATLRRTLLELIQLNTAQCSKVQLLAMLRNWPTEFSSKHPAALYSNTDSLLVNEALLMFACYRHLAQSRCEITARYLHIYLLIQSLFHRLLNQQLLDKGFQQFEKITQNELREATEEKFAQRFEQLQGMYGSPITLLEARFAPKNDTYKLRSILQALNNGYQKSALYERAPLSLTAHFIKAKDRPAALHPCRHYPLRLRLQKQKQVLLNYLQKNHTLREQVLGVDAAGNEMDAGAEVFAPLYRQLRSEGFKHFTYHAGEDFLHLLSGMRQVFEAIEFLDLKPGDRIGHATAIGIDPMLWLQRAAAWQQISYGEWLDTLLFTHHVLLQAGDAESSSHAYRMESDIHRLAEHVFDRCDFNIQALKTAWLNRWRDPLGRSCQPELAGMAGCLLAAWHAPAVYKRARILKNVRADFLPAEMYRKIQDALLKICCQKQIALEVLPTSNVRISYYRRYSEHHIHRWLQPGAVNRPSVVIGSDDPGIFSTNIFNEYAHVFISAHNKRSSGTSDPVQLVRELVANGKDFGFQL